MKRIALLALMLAACFIMMSMPVMGETYSNRLNLSMNTSIGKVASDVILTDTVPYSYQLADYPSKIVYNEKSGKAVNYDGYGADAGVVLKKNEVAYDSLATEIRFSDDGNNFEYVPKILTGNGRDNTGVLQLFFYPEGAPSIEVYTAAKLAAIETLGSAVRVVEHKGNLAGFPGKTWEIIVGNNVMITGFTRLNDYCIQDYTCDVVSYQEMGDIQYWGV